MNLNTGKTPRSAKIADKAVEIVIKTISFTSFAVILLIFYFVFKEALPGFQKAKPKETSPAVLQQETYGEEPDTTNLIHENSGYSSLETSGSEGKLTVKNLTSNEWQPVSSNPRYGLIPLFIGSFKVTFIAILFGGPLAILAALFTAFFAPKGLKEIIKPVIEMLASFPSVVIGFFALITLASFIQNLFHTEYRLNAFVGGIAMALAVIPIVFTVAEDAITSVPRVMTEASLALGAYKWQTAIYVVLPAATPGIIAALILGFGRAFGETMIVLMATGNAAQSSLNIFLPVRTLSATIGAEMAEVVVGDIHYQVLFLIGALLFIFTFTLNAFVEFYVKKRLLKKFRGEG